MNTKKNNKKISSVEIKIQRIMEVEKKLNFINNNYSSIMHDLNNSINILISNSYILIRNIKYYESLIKNYKQSNGENINKIKYFDDGIEVNSIEDLSMEAITQIEIVTKNIVKKIDEINDLVNK